MKTPTFNAPWDAGVKLITMLASAILGYYILSFLHHRTQLSEAQFVIRLVLPLLLFGLGFAFMVTGYTVDARGVTIQRLFWKRRIRREDISSVAIPSLVTGSSMGLCGIWGFFSRSGFAYSRGLGFHIVAACAFDRRVVIARHHGLPVIISPSDSEAFIHAFYD